MLEIVFERMFDLINANQKGVSSSGGRAEKEDIFFFVFLCFLRVTEKLSFKGIQRNFFYDFFNKDGKNDLQGGSKQRIR